MIRVTAARPDAVAAYIGIDPGLSGAIAVLWADGNLDIMDTPTAVVKNTRRDYLVNDMAVLAAGLDGSVAAIEAARGMPRQSSATTFKQGYGCGLWQGILAARDIPYDVVDPQRWKRALGLPVGADKGASRVLASRLFPAAAGMLTRTKDDGRAEALLLAEWRRRQG